MPEEVLVNSTNTNDLESFFSRIEGMASSVIDELIKSVAEYKAIDPVFKIRLIPSLLMQYIRTAKYRRTILPSDEISTINPNEFIEFQKTKIPESDSKIQSGIGYPSWEHAKCILNVDMMIELSKILISYIWIFGITASSYPFHTSDVPVAKVSHDGNSIDHFASFESFGVEIAYPISPTLILIILEKEYFKEIAHLDCICLPLEKRFIDYYNEIQFIESDRFIFSSNRDFFEDA